MRKRKNLCCSTLLCIGLARGRTKVLTPWKGWRRGVRKQGSTLSREQRWWYQLSNTTTVGREQGRLPTSHFGGRDGMSTR